MYAHNNHMCVHRFYIFQIFIIYNCLIHCEVHMKQETLTVLKNLSTINKSIRISTGNVLTIFNPSIPLYARAVVDDKFPKSFSIYDLNQWLATLSLFNDPDISFEDKQMVINGGRMNAKYRYSAAAVTADQPTDEITLPETLFSFTMPREQLQEILKATSVLCLKELEFSIHGLRAFNSNAKGEAIDNEYTTAIENVQFENEAAVKKVKIKVEALRLMSLDYVVSINEKAVVFESVDNSIKYVAGLIVG